jgi:hypothetical protein
MRTPASLRASDEVLASMNQRSSAMTARVKTRFVVRRGRMGVPERLRENFRGRGAKREYVPVPVLYGRQRADICFCRE